MLYPGTIERFPNFYYNVNIKKGGTMIGIVALIVLVLDIIALVDILKSSADTGNKALWVILILILPVIGMVLYFLIGKKMK